MPAVVVGHDSLLVGKAFRILAIIGEEMRERLLLWASKKKGDNMTNRIPNIVEFSKVSPFFFDDGLKTMFRQHERTGRPLGGDSYFDRPLCLTGKVPAQIAEKLNGPIIRGSYKIFNYKVFIRFSYK